MFWVLRVTAVLLQLNVRYKTRVAPKLTGIRSDPRLAKLAKQQAKDEQPGAAQEA